jgi:hypothetical protein
VASSINAGAGGAVAMTVHALRKDGFDAEIAASLKNAPPGFALAGARIPRGRDSVRMTLTMSRDAPGQPVALQLEGRATISETVVTRPVVPAEEMMQAFADNLIIEAYTETAARPGAPAAQQKRRASPGILPAIPFEVVKP